MFTKKTYNNLRTQGIELIPCEEIIINSDPEKTIGCDFTVDKFYTFCTSDGIFVQDTMSVFAPISQEAQEEAKKKMMVITSNEDINIANYALSNEVLTGLYTLTHTQNKTNRRKIDNFEQLQLLHIGDNINIYFKNQQRNTTVGKIIFNHALPQYYPFVDEDANKSTVKTILSDIIEKNKNDFIDTLDNLMKLGFIYATAYPKSLDISKLQISKKLKDLKDKLAKEKDINKQTKIIDEMKDEMMIHIKDKYPTLYYQIKAGATKDPTQIRQMMVSKGITVDPMGNTLPPIVASISDGYSPSEYFDASASARSGLISKAIGTSQGGYEYRKVMFSVGNAKLNKSNPDCGTKRYLTFKLNKSLYKRLRGRYIVNNNKIEPISESHIGKIINLRSPIFCKSLSICRLCYGDLAQQINSENIGIIATQEVASLSERFMKLFHLGGVVDVKIVDIFEEILNTIDDAFLPILKNNFYQEDSDLLNKIECKVVIPKKIFTSSEKYKIEEDEKFIKLPIGYFDLEFNDTVLNISINKPVYFYKEKVNILNEDDTLNLNYSTKDTKLFKVDPTSVNYSKVTVLIDDIIGGKVPFRNVNELYRYFMSAMAPSGGFASVHLEVILSNVLRNKKDPQYPARVKEPYEYKMISIKKLPSVISWPLGLAFENFSKSIQYGMISDRGEESQIEKVLLGMPLVETKKGKKKR